MQKLRDKNQTEEQQKQAGHAVSIYLDMVKAGAKAASADKVQAGDQPLNSITQGEVKAFREPLEHAEEKQPSVPPKDSRQTVALKQYAAYCIAKKQWQTAIADMTAVIKTKHYSPKTLRSYEHWAWKLQGFRKDIAPASLTTEDVKAFLSWLAVSCNVSASSQNQAFNAILFFFRHSLKKDFDQISDVVRAKRRPYIPVVLSRDEVAAVISHLYPPYNLIVKTMYGCGLRLFECLKLRVHNFNFDAGVLTIHDGKGQKDRTVPLPQSIMAELHAQLERLKKLHDRDLASEYAGVSLGHSDVRTTMIYTHCVPSRTVKEAKSPLDF